MPQWKNFFKKRTKSSWTNSFGQRQWKSHYIIKKWSGLVAQKCDCSSGWIEWRVHWMNMRNMVWICSLTMLLLLWNYFRKKKNKSEPIWTTGSTGRTVRFNRSWTGSWPVHWCSSSIPAIGPNLSSFWLNRPVRFGSGNLDPSHGMLISLRYQPVLSCSRHLPTICSLFSSGGSTYFKLECPSINIIANLRIWKKLYDI